MNKAEVKERKFKNGNILFSTETVDDMTTLTITSDRMTIKNMFLDMIQKSSQDDERLMQTTRLYFVSQSIENQSAQAIDFLNDVGLLHYLDGWSYLLPTYKNRVESLLGE